MIITDPNSIPSASSKAAEAASESSRNVASNSDELPPPYVGGPSALPALPPSRVFRGKPGNFVTISRLNGSVTLTQVIDATLDIPAALLPPIPEGETSRRNLDLQSKNGSVDADISLVPNDLGRRTKLFLKSLNGHVKAVIHRPGTGPVFHLTASSWNGQVTAVLPRSFCGVVVAGTKNGSVRFSEGIQQNQTLFSDVSGTSTSFIGDPGLYLEKQGRDWTGDEIHAETKNGNIRFRFEDELPPQNAFAKFWSNWF
ncbi:hypothetical protein C8J56DRAFT_450512 [Mycena floridula]|nr:hypothetical protein C8J56DRAFT_450512 [Mycena floridula]